ncbi:MAG: metallophosphoesterase [Planctomycetota bacterium]
MNGNKDLKGILLIGDPHVQARQPDFRRDNFAETVLRKIQWCLDYAKENCLLPAFLGDLFDHARNNRNFIIVKLMEMLQGSGAVGIYGNHDCVGRQLDENDSLSILVTAGCLRLVSVDDPWVGRMNGRRVVVTGSSYREEIRHEFDPATVASRFGPAETLFDSEPFVVWLTHEDLVLKGYDSGRCTPFQIRNVELLVNGHIHRELEPVQAGHTLWMNPGSITRTKRSDATREHKPHVTRVDVDMDSWEVTCVEVPHAPFEEVFYEQLIEADPERPEGVTFAAGLKELQTRSTDTGAGLHQFIQANTDQFDEPVANELLALAAAVTNVKEPE